MGDSNVGKNNAKSSKDGAKSSKDGAKSSKDGGKSTKDGGKSSKDGGMSEGKTGKEKTSRSTTSKNDEKSCQMPEAMNMPLELAEPEPEQTAKKGFFKKLFMKIGERVGNVKQTELSKEYLDAVNRVDAYHAVVQEVCKQCCRMIQQNPQHFAAAENMHVQSPKGKDPFEELCQYLKPAIKELPKPEPITAARESCKRLALFHRQMQDDVRKAMHFLRTFVNVDYPAFEEERQKLLKVRQNMDRARADYEIGPTEGKKYSYGIAKQQFLEQTDKVMQMVTDINKKKEDHVTDLIVILRAMHKYHHQSMLECQSLRPQRAILGEPTRYDLL